MKVLLAIALLGLLAAAFLWERSATDGLRAQNESLRAEAAEAGQLTDANHDLPVLRAAAGTTNQVDRAELLRLRNEVRRLRAQQPEVEKLRAANQRVAEELKSGKFTPRRLADMEGAVPREKWTFAGFATPETAAQSYCAAVTAGDLQQIVRCVTPEFGEYLSKAFEDEPERARRKFNQIGAYFSVSELVLSRKVSDDEVQVYLSATHVNDEAPRHLGLKFRRIGAEWKLDK